MCKNLVLLRDVINVYHPTFSTNKQLQKYALESPTAFNVERLIEECLAHVGGYDFVNEEGRDFNDTTNSDSKTLTVNPAKRRAELGSIANKIGSLRITIYNPHKDNVDYMYMTYEEWNYFKVACHGKNQEDKTRLLMSWSRNGHYNQFERFRVADFIELATTQRKGLFTKT
jgi:hypothetical protein